MVTYCVNCNTRPCQSSTRCECRYALCDNCWNELFEDKEEYKKFRKTIYIKNGEGNYEEVVEVLYQRVVIEADPVCPKCGVECKPDEYNGF